MIVPRTTLTMTGRQTLANLERIRARRQRATEEIATGLRVRRPSDGPSDAAGVVRTTSDLERIAQFRVNLRSVSEQLRAGDTALSNAINLVQRAALLASQAANFNQTAETRAGIAVEVRALIENLVTIANTEFGGKFLFSGLAEETRPFLIDASSSNGVTYRGDQGRRSVALPGGPEIPSSLDGRTIFLRAESFRGSGRTAGFSGSVTPNPPAGIGITFSEGVNTTLYADLPSFFVGPVPPAVPAPGDQVTVSFTATDGSLSGSITATLAGGETAAQIAAALNAEIALSPSLAGIAFSDEGGRLKIVESDTAGVGFDFSATSTGGLVTGLESGGRIGGLSAGEIAAALNAQALENPSLSAAGVRFTAVGGEIEVDADVDLTFTVVDFTRGTGFASGLAGRHQSGGDTSVNIFRLLKDLHAALVANDEAAIQGTLGRFSSATTHLSKAQGFYGSTESQLAAALGALSQFELVNRERLASFQEADLVRSISELTQAQTNEEAALRVAATEPGPSLFDFLA